MFVIINAFHARFGTCTDMPTACTDMPTACTDMPTTARSGRMIVHHELDLRLFCR